MGKWGPFHCENCRDKNYLIECGCNNNHIIFLRTKGRRYHQCVRGHKIKRYNCIKCNVLLNENNHRNYNHYICNKCDDKFRRENEIKRGNIEKLRRRLHRQKLRLDVMKYYSKGEIKCALCNFNDLRALTLDHVGGGGNNHRKIITSRTIYHWLIKNNYPQGYRVLCMNCQFIEKYEWYIKNGWTNHILSQGPIVQAPPPPPSPATQP